MSSHGQICPVIGGYHCELVKARIRESSRGHQKGIFRQSVILLHAGCRPSARYVSCAISESSTLAKPKETVVMFSLAYDPVVLQLQLPVPKEQEQQSQQ